MADGTIHIRTDGKDYAFRGPEQPLKDGFDAVAATFTVSAEHAELILKHRAIRMGMLTILNTVLRGESVKLGDFHDDEFFLAVLPPLIAAAERIRAARPA